RPLLIGCGAIIALLGALSVRQAGVWHDDLSLAEHGVALYPASVDAQSTLGRALATAGRVEDAIPHFRMVLEQRPTSPMAHLMLGRALAAIGNLEGAERELAIASRLAPDDAGIADEFDAIRARARHLASPTTNQ